MTSEPQPSDGVSAVFARSEAMRPRVQQPNSPWTVIAGLGAAAALGVFAFTSLSNARAAHAQTAPPRLDAAGQPTPAWAPALQMMMAQNQAVNPVPPSAQAAPPAPTPAPLPAAPQPNPSEANWKAPAVVVDLSEPGGAAATTRLAQAGAAGAPTAATAEDARLNPEERFAARVSGSLTETARAIQMRDLARIVPQGFVIPAVLETAIDSDLPGSVRAVVSRDVRGFDGSQVLIPRGSKLIGQYRSAAAVGQTRAFVVWSRIITPGGVSVDVGSPATDQLGRGGLAGKADTHFFERFGASILLSVISAGVNAAGASSGSSTAIVIGSSTQANQVASIALQKQIDIPTTIRVPQGAPVQVSVARDLDFSGVAPR
ncbi:type IV secretion system protein VirB10 [Phenylobacterium sp.]|uniref:type IV secretion system protein VirB10 n=1 Tax=Phenylobacterium sp. TaxID=1871053 RepID=UPI0011F49C15|nr:type IV secretion system protein VirB10 [Phenylobacterium sp.]THD67259.1 MAG: TrbI/VirB10 family protein [Phenylobacterium sp.]